jgi:hypothetical protein
MTSATTATAAMTRPELSMMIPWTGPDGRLRESCIVCAEGEAATPVLGAAGNEEDREELSGIVSIVTIA